MKQWSNYHLLTIALSVIIMMYMMSSGSVVIAWDLTVGDTLYLMYIILDDMSKTFLIMVSMVSSMVLIYSTTYMYNDSSKVGFSIIMMMFIACMMCLSVSGNLVMTIIGWDGLGITSMCLIMYYQNWNSFNSSMITFMSNRIGDYFIMISMILTMGFDTSWVSLEVGMLLLMSALTKSAQVPFSSWLPMAMAAPTPVSSLVHSSTLVTAGVYLIIRFSESMGGEVLMILKYMSMLTMIIAGLSSMVEFDVKKIVAYSTLLHISLMMYAISIGGIKGATIHMLMHAFFKSLLFMVVGEVIHANNNNQDIRLINVPIYWSSLSIPMMVSMFSMMGMPFMSGFYSKEELMQLMINLSMVEITVMMLGVMFTVAYTMRMMSFMFSSTRVEEFWGLKSSMLTGYSILSSVGSGACITMISKTWDVDVELEWGGEVKMVVLPVIITLGVLVGMSMSHGYSLTMLMTNNMGMKGLTKIWNVTVPIYVWFMKMVDMKGVQEKTLQYMTNKVAKIDHFMLGFSSTKPMRLFVVTLTYLSILYLLM